LFYVFVSRGAKFGPFQALRADFEYLGPGCLDACAEPPIVDHTTPFLSEVIKKFGIWHPRFHHPRVESVRWSERLKLLRKVLVDGDGAITFRVRSFCLG
jgi:hypothetical protein